MYSSTWLNYLGANEVQGWGASVTELDTALCRHCIYYMKSFVLSKLKIFL